MPYVNQAIQPKLDSLPLDLKNEILSRDVRLETMNDLISVLEKITEEE